MKKSFLYFILMIVCGNVFSMADSIVIPIQRQRNHERINEEQVKCDKADGKLDGIIKVSGNEEINLQVTDALVRKINNLQNFVETSKKIVSNNEKIRQLNYIQELLISFRTEWKSKRLNPVLAPLLVDNFEKILKATIDTVSMVELVKEVPYEIAKINIEIFKSNKGYTESKNILFIKFGTLHPDLILATIRPYINESFADVFSYTINGLFPF